MAQSPAFVLQLELDHAGDAISGRVNVAPGIVLPFFGWVGLAAALERATTVDRDGSTPPTGEGAP